MVGSSIPNFTSSLLSPPRGEKPPKYHNFDHIPWRGKISQTLYHTKIRTIDMSGKYYRHWSSGRTGEMHCPWLWSHTAQFLVMRSAYNIRYHVIRSIKTAHIHTAHKQTNKQTNEHTHTLSLIFALRDIASIHRNPRRNNRRVGRHFVIYWNCMKCPNNLQ